MFHSARLTLTAWYVLIIMVICLLFSVAFYHVSTREIQRLINRMSLEQQVESSLSPRELPPRPRNAPSLEELRELKHRSLVSLILLNILLLVGSGTASYFLAGKTLQPIKNMMAEQQEFIANASHELRTPIATLRAEMEGSLLEKKISDTQARALIRSNLEELGTLQELTNALLQLAHFNVPNDKVLTEKIVIKQLVAAARKKISPLAKEKQILITTHVPNLVIHGNRQSLTTALVILLENAIKYSSSASPITISAEQTAKLVAIHITDHGIGITKTDIPHIFERFYRADKSRSQTNGYGLGLSIAKQIIAAHHGSITVSSIVGNGSTFTIQLPA